MVRNENNTCIIVKELFYRDVSNSRVVIFYLPYSSGHVTAQTASRKIQPNIERKHLAMLLQKPTQRMDNCQRTTASQRLPILIMQSKNNANTRENSENGHVIRHTHVAQQHIRGSKTAGSVDCRRREVLVNTFITIIFMV